MNTVDMPRPLHSREIESVPESVPVTLTKDEAVLIAQLLVSVGPRDPQAPLAKSTFTTLIKAMQAVHAA